ncbi:hypothetical protein F5880DRAFT_1642072 [Lentinula raphanica]|nr:hypothetical protein F5880DRAFT_1642072 [Lentinula raphanica]
MENTSSDKVQSHPALLSFEHYSYTLSQKAESSKVPETHITRPSRKKGFRREIKTRITVPRDYQVDYARGRDESYKKPLQLFYGFGLNRKDIMGYYETYISPELPELITPGVKDAFLDDLIKHCDFPNRHTKSAFVNDLVKITFPKLILEHARVDDQWHGGMYSYILRLYTSYDLPLTELPEEAEQRVFSRLRSRLEVCQKQEPSWFRPSESCYYTCETCTYQRIQNGLLPIRDYTMYTYIMLDTPGHHRSLSVYRGPDINNERVSYLLQTIVVSNIEAKYQTLTHVDMENNPRARRKGTEGRSTSSVSKEESQDRYKIRTVVPKGFEVDYRRMLDESYKKPLRLYYGFGVNRNDIMGYIKAFVSSDFPDFLDDDARNTFVKSLKRYCCKYLGLEPAKYDDWNEERYSYCLRLYSSYDLHLIEMREEVEQKVISRLRERLETCRGQEPKWFRPAEDWYYDSE